MQEPAMSQTQKAERPKPVSKATRAKVQTIAGYRLPEPRITPMAVWLVVLWVGLPVLAVGGLMDLAAQVFFGVCTGLWCIPAR
jgi:hypothetical protein